MPGQFTRQHCVTSRPARPPKSRCYWLLCICTQAQSPLDAFLMQIFDWFWLNLEAIYVACPHPGSASSHYGCQVARRCDKQLDIPQSRALWVAGSGLGSHLSWPQCTGLSHFTHYPCSHYLSLHGLTTHSRLSPPHNLPSYRVNSCKSSHS